MADRVVKIYTPGGKLVGLLMDPKVDMEPAHYYEISGTFVSDEGNMVEKVEFNPQVLPYVLDIGSVKKCTHDKLHLGYVQRGRQPVVITAECKLH